MAGTPLTLNRKRKRNLLTQELADGSVDYAYNSMTSIDLDIITGKEAIFAHNDIRSLQITQISVQIEYLDLSYCKLESLPEDLQFKLPSLKQFYLQGNRLFSMPDLRSLHYLKELNLGDWIGGNQLRALENLPNGLKRLSVCNNQLEWISLPVGLEYLDASFNLLTFIPINSALRELRVCGNKISHIPTHFYHTVASTLILLDVSMNELVERVHEIPGVAVYQENQRIQQTGKRQPDSLFSLCIEACMREHIKAVPFFYYSCLYSSIVFY